jgi:hypothetical protein
MDLLGFPIHQVPNKKKKLILIRKHYSNSVSAFGFPIVIDKLDVQKKNK